MSVGISQHMSTRHERWCTRISGAYEGTWYDLCTSAAVDWIGEPGHPAARLLIIGSPVVEFERFRERGWSNLVYVDVRRPPLIDKDWVQCDATDLSRFDNYSFDAVSTTGVLTHVGLGRYGDVRVANGDFVALKEISRVIKPGCRAALSFGALIDAPEPVIWGTTHKIYNIAEADRLLAASGFEKKSHRIYRPGAKRWLRDDEALATDPERFDWISTFAVKPC